MLQFIYSESEAVANEIVEAVASEAPETTKEEIAEVAAEKAEEIADAVANASEAAGEPVSEEAYAELVTNVAQLIYTSTMADLADAQACYALESLFSEEAVEEYYSSLEAAKQEVYADENKSIFARVKGGVSGGYKSAKTWTTKNKKNAAIVGGGAGAAAGAGLGALIAKKRGTSVKKGALVGAVAGSIAGGSAAAGGKFLHDRRKK